VPFQKTGPLRWAVAAGLFTAASLIGMRESGQRLVARSDPPALTRLKH
jgi:hypothetical protein